MTNDILLSFLSLRHLFFCMGLAFIQINSHSKCQIATKFLWGRCTCITLILIFFKLVSSPITFPRRKFLQAVFIFSHPRLYPLITNSCGSLRHIFGNAPWKPLRYTSRDLELILDLICLPAITCRVRFLDNDVGS